MNFYHAQYRPVLQDKLNKALERKGPSYKPRTEHLDESGKPLFTNRLILEDSPYLLQHAHNPVDWFAWGPEAFAKAKLENKPIFLSIGYSTCHWCHVMEKESFENLQIASLLNQFYVPIKVDRERRPAIDATYMMAVTMIAGRGGWPMSSFLTPEGKTFYGGTYFKPADFERLLSGIHETWKKQQQQVEQQADHIAKSVVQQSSNHAQSVKLSEASIKQAVKEILSTFDAVKGGFSQAPKFPNEPSLFLLLNEALKNKDPKIIGALRVTLDAMAKGGIFDQIGGGFHRYSTDDDWLVPHFEKMLYNQANLARVYLLAWQLTGNQEYRRIVRQTLDYVLDEMTSPNGGFYSATDADSEGEEGRYFVWTLKQIDDVLSEKDTALAKDLYQITEQGNFEGANILHRKTTVTEYARAHHLSYRELVKKISSINQLLYVARKKRVAPLRDEKIITAWNGMMISALALAGKQLNDPKYSKAAVRASEFIFQPHKTAKGSVFRVHLDGKASVQGTQEDYAYLAEGFINLYDVDSDKKWLKLSMDLSNKMMELFWDKKDGGFYMDKTEKLVEAMGRAKDSYDGAMPSGNAVAVNVLQKLYRRTSDPKYKPLLEKLISAFSEKINRFPSAFAFMLTGVDDLYQGESGSVQFAERGTVAVDAMMTKNGLKVALSIEPNWHINSNKPLQEQLIATDLRVASDSSEWKLANIKFPKSAIKTLGFQQQPLSLFEGKILIEAQLIAPPTASPSVTIELTLQACNQNRCLFPETLRLNLMQWIDNHQ